MIKFMDMLRGIKFGLSDWKKLLGDYLPECCEVWFRIDWSERYQEMFSYLKTRKIPTGLHFWGMLPSGIMPNFAFTDRDVIKNSVKLVKQTIDIASKYNFHYVNIHPGSYILSKINLKYWYARPIPERKVSAKTGNQVLFENMEILARYAENKGTQLYIETLPLKEPLQYGNQLAGRLHTQEMQNVTIGVIEKLANKKFLITNDLGHTAMQVVSDDRKKIFKFLMDKTNKLALQTRLLHINTVPPPFNGTDCHLGITKKDFLENVFPSREQLKEILRIFINRKDVWAIPEPYKEHLENTKALIEILEEIEKERS